MIYLFLADGFETVEALCPLDLLRRAGANVKTVGVTGKTVTSRQGVPVTADLVIDEISIDDRPEMIILPGGLPGADNLDKNKELDRMIKVCAVRGAYLAAICAAPYLLGARGILEGKKATCYPDPTFIDRLIGTEYVDAGVVCDDNVITARAMGSSVEFGLELIKVLFSEEKANEIAASIYFEK
ncbi:MAG: DJ-1/PfpI family protein [Clostridia bacterium]|nr:DJ-1/PfpI family protein [Clostridia bacterium]